MKESIIISDFIKIDNQFLEKNRKNILPSIDFESSAIRGGIKVLITTPEVIHAILKDKGFIHTQKKYYNGNLVDYIFTSKGLEDFKKLLQLYCDDFATLEEILIFGG